MKRYVLFDGESATTDWVSGRLAKGGCATSFGCIAKYWAFYYVGRLWEAMLFESSRDRLRLVNRDHIKRGDMTEMMDRLMEISDGLDGFRLDIELTGEETLTVCPYIEED